MSLYVSLALSSISFTARGGVCSTSAKEQLCSASTCYHIQLTHRQASTPPAPNSRQFEDRQLFILILFVLLAIALVWVIAQVCAVRHSHRTRLADDESILAPIALERSMDEAKKQQ